MEEKNHRHITQRQAEWYSGLLKSLTGKNRSIEDCGFWTRLRAERILRKRMECSVCYESFSIAYYDKKRGKQKL